MSQAPPSPPASGEGVAGDAARIAGGSAVVLAGGVGETGLRFLTSWFLARFFGPAAYGLYAATSTAVQLLASVAPLGLDGGSLYFGARYARADERGALKGMLRFAYGVVALTGPLAALGLWAFAGWGEAWLADKPGLAPALRLASGAVLAGTLLAVAVGSIQAAKDMRSNALYFQLALPGLTLLGSVAAWLAGADAQGPVAALTVAYVGTALLCLRVVWRRHGALLRDRAIQAERRVGAWLRYSLPQSLARTLYRANMWADVLMLTALRDLDEVGIYRVGVTIAAFGLLPAMAITTMFNPTIAELVQARELARLDALLKVVTRWLVMVAAPGYLVVLLLPDLCMSVFDSAYVAGAGVLGVLMIGQAIYLACSVAGAMIPMAGFAGLNMVHNLVAVVVNVGLNAVLIPRYGMLGAATASTVALGGWSLWRVGTVWRLLRCFPFSWRTAGIVGLAVAVGALTHALVGGQGLPVRVLGTVLAGAAVVGASAAFGRTADDAVVVERFRARFGGLVARFRR